MCSVAESSVAEPTILSEQLGAPPSHRIAPRPPPIELFMQMPLRAEILRGLLGADLVGPLAAATTTAGQIVAVVGDREIPSGGAPGALFGEGFAGSPLRRISALGGPAGLVATADGYIGDADVVSTTTTLGGSR